MNIFNISGLGVEELKRLKGIVSVLANYGFGELFVHLSLPGKFMLPKARKEKLEHPRSVRLRMALEEMGTTFIKLGQFASTRPDYVPREYVKELSKLRDEVNPVEFSEIEDIFIDEWGEQWREKFITFFQKPIAAASIAQVYKARLKNGRLVAVKVRRPGVEKQVSSDLKIISFIARFVEKRYEWAKVIQPGRLVEEFSRALKRELDLKRESVIIRKFKENHRQNREVVIPGVEDEITTEKILIMDFIEGVSLDKADFSPQEKKRIAKLGVNVMMTQILEHGLFHADPHPGNLIYTKDGKLSYLDFGLIGRLSTKMKNGLTGLMLDARSGEPELVLQEMMIQVNIEKEIDKETMIREIMEIMDRNLMVTIDEISIGKTLMDVFDLFRQNRIKIHPAYTMVAKAILTSEETAKSLDRSMNVMKEITPGLKKLYLKKYRPRNVLIALRLLSKDLQRLFEEMPGQMAQILRKLKSGQLEIEFRHVGLEDLIRALDRVSNRISFGLIIAALIVGSSLVIQSEMEPMIFDVPAVGFIGFVIASVMGLWLLWSIIKSGRFK